VLIYFSLTYFFYRRVFLKNLFFIKKIFPEIDSKEFNLKIFPKIALVFTLFLPSKMILNVGWKEKNTVIFYAYLLTLSFICWIFLFSFDVYLMMVSYLYLLLHLEIFIFSFLYHRNSFFNAKLILFLGVNISLDKVVHFYLGNPWDIAKRSAVLAAGTLAFFTELVREHGVADRMADIYMEPSKPANTNVLYSFNEKVDLLESHHQANYVKLEKVSLLLEHRIEKGNSEAQTIQALVEINKQKMLLDSEFSSQHMKLSSEFNKAIVDARFSYRDQALRAQPIYHALSSTKVVSNISFEYKDSSQ
jgi:hypothetical protein